MTGAAPAPDWDALADRIEALADELMATAPAAPDETEGQLLELQAISIRHVAYRLRLYPARV